MVSLHVCSSERLEQHNIEASYSEVVKLAASDHTSHQLVKYCFVCLVLMLVFGYERREFSKSDHTIEDVYGAGQNPVLPQKALANVTEFKRFKPSSLPNKLGNRLNYFLARKWSIKFDMLQASKAIKILNEGFEKRKLPRNLLTELIIANNIFG